MKTLQYILCLLLISSCSYEPEGLHYFEVTKPDPSHPFELTLSADKDSILIFGDTYFHYDLNTFGKEFNGLKISFHNWTTNRISTKDSFLINDASETQWDDLVLDFYVRTGSGSLADQFKKENYKISRTFKVKRYDLSKENLKVGYQINANGNMEVYFIKPTICAGKSFSVQANSYNMQSTNISGDTVFFEDELYLFGPKTYNFGFQFSNGVAIHNTLEINFPEPEISYQNLGFDSCRAIITNHSKIKQYYSCTNSYSIKTKDNEFHIYYSIGNIHEYSFFVSKTSGNMNFSNAVLLKKKYFLGGYANYSYCYSPDKDQFYILRRENLTNIESTGNIVPTKIPENYENPQYDKIRCSANGKYIAAFHNNTIYNFNQNLTLANTISTPQLLSYRNYFAVTNDGVFTYAEATKVVLQNLDPNAGWSKLSFDIDITEYYQYINAIANTLDGNYLCVAGNNSFTIYDVSNHTSAKVMYSDTKKSYHGVLAHPREANLIYVKGLANTLELRTCPGFELVKSYELPIKAYYVYSLNPSNNDVLLIDNVYYYVYDLDQGLLKNKIPRTKNSSFNTISDVSIVKNLMKIDYTLLNLNDYK